MAITKRLGKTSIDAGPPKTVEEHFNVILNDDSYIEGEHKKVTPADLPQWFDYELFKKGQNYYNNNLLGMDLAYFISMIVALLVPSIAQGLAFSKQSSTPCTAFKRYLQTILHFAKTHTHDIMDADSDFYKSVNVIRWKHSTSSKRFLKCQREGIWQRDMVLAQCSFVYYVLAQPKKLALTDDPEERRGFNHMWRVIGYMLGIPDRINVCREDEQETTQLCKKLIKEEFLKNLNSPTAEFHTLSVAAIEGLSAVNPSIDLDVVLAFFYEINDSKYEKPLSFYSKLNLFYQNANLYLIGTPVIGSVLRSWWNIVIRCMLWIGENYPILAWMKYGKKRTLQIQLYPQTALAS